MSANSSQLFSRPVDGVAPIDQHRPGRVLWTDWNQVRMTDDAPLPMTHELLLAHPVYQRAQTILQSWHANKLQLETKLLSNWRKDQQEALKLVNNGAHAPKSEWLWNLDREIVAKQLLREFLHCTHPKKPEDRMEAWRNLRRTVALWDEKFACDNDVA